MAPRSLVPSGRPFWHSWNSKDDETVLDASVPDPTACHYFGLPIADDGMFDTMVIGEPVVPKPLIPLNLTPGYINASLRRSFGIL